jgi:general secretion pathway protein D
VRPNAKYMPVINSDFVEINDQAGGGGGAAGGEGAANEKDFPLLLALREALSPEGGMNYISTSNVLIVRDTAQVHSELTKIISKIDVEPAQVFMDVKFVSTSSNDLFNLGVDYGEFGPQVSLSGGQIPITFPFNQGSGGFEDVLIANPGGTGPFTGGGNAGETIIPDTVFGSLSFTGVLATLRLLQRDSTTEVVQHPKLIALDGHEATIFVGETIRYATAKSEQGQAGGLQLSVTEASGSPVETGFQLLVIPNVIPGSNRVMMQIIPKETSLVGTGDPSVAPPGFDVFTVGASGLEGSIALPHERSSTIVTSMLLDSGQTAVVGGLTTEFDQKTVQRIPGLSSIPLLGWLFQHEERARTKSSLLVFVTPTVIRTAAETQALLDRELRNRHGAYGDRLRDILYGTEPSIDGGKESTSSSVGVESKPDDYVLSEDMDGKESEKIPAAETEK